jgi:integrase
MEAAHQSALAKGDVGIFEREPAPTLAAFAREFLVWAQTNFREKPKTLSFYSNGIRRLLEYQPLASLTLDDKKIAERLVGYVAKRQAQKLQVSSINRELQVLRWLLHLAIEWGRIESAATIKMLHGEQHRELVVSPAEESRYLAAAPSLLNSFATVLVDTGMRPEECNRLRWEQVTWINGRHRTLLVTHGKTKSPRRVLPLSIRVRKVLEARWDAAQRPTEGWDAPTKSGHVELSSLKKQHARALKLSKVRSFCTACGTLFLLG